MDLASLRFIEENRPILFLGQPGCGKTHLAVALATRAVEAGYQGYFSSADDMCRQLVAAMVDGSFRTKLRTYTTPTVLVIDDVGLLPIESTQATSAFFHVVDERSRKATPPWSPPTGACPTGESIRRPHHRLRHLGPAHTPGRRLQHQRTVLAAPRAPSPRHRRHRPRKDITSSDSEEP